MAGMILGSADDPSSPAFFASERARVDAEEEQMRRELPAFAEQFWQRFRSPEPLGLSRRLALQIGRYWEILLQTFLS
jgi:hypothetical protein